MAELFQTTIPNVSMHIRNVFAEGELERGATDKESLTVQPTATVKEFLIVRQEGSRQVSRAVEHYNLDVIISVGYRVKSHRGTQFRVWATQRLREYIVKGFTMDDERLKQSGGGNYFDELLARIRDIRSSEKAFWRKVLEIYATSIDYDPGVEASQQFFATVQNKMHWGAHGHTAAEIIHARADAAQPHMGLTAWIGSRPRKGDVVVAKNYLGLEEIGDLNLIVSMYLDFGELQVRSRKPMYMRDWIAKLDDFLKVSGRELLDHAGRFPTSRRCERRRRNTRSSACWKRPNRRGWKKILRRRSKNCPCRNAKPRSDDAEIPRPTERENVRERHRRVVGDQSALPRASGHGV